MRIEKVPDGYLLAREGEGGIEIWRQFNGAESWACAAIDELIAERDALRAELSKQQALTDAAQHIAEVAQSRANQLQAKIEAAEKSDAESLAMYRKARDERDALRAALQHEADCVEAAKAEIEALRAKRAEMEQQEPVAWQTRTRPAWNDGTWGPWRKCSEEYAEDIKKTPLLHDWLYEARALYALPGAKGE